MSNGIIEYKPFEDYDLHVAESLNQLTSGVANPEQWLIDALGGSTSTAGVRVNTDTVLGLPAAWRSIDLIAGKLGSMPICVERKQSRGGFKAIEDHPVERLLNRWCSPLYTTFTLRQTMTLHSLLEGNARAYIERDGVGNPISLTLMQPKQVYTIVINGEKYHVAFFSRDQCGDVLTPELEASLSRFGASRRSNGNGSYFEIPDSEVLHIPGLSYNGLWGMPLVNVARDAFGVDQAGMEAVAYQFANGGRPGLLLTAPKGLFPTEKQAREYLAMFKGKHEGTKNQGRIGMMREGMTAETLDAANTFAGMSDLTDKTKGDIALLFGTEYLLGEISAVYKDLQSRMTAFVQNTLDKWMETWEQEAGRKLLRRQRYLNGSLRIHMDPTKILRGTPNELAEYTSSLRTQGLISGNEGRGYHGLSPVEGLDDDYGNPAISTPDDEQEQEPEPAEETETEEPENSIRGQRAIRRHFDRMMQFEHRRVLECAEEEQGFFERIDAFYDSLELQMRELCEDLLMSTDIAMHHCKRNRKAIIEVAGCVVGAEQLQTELKALVSTWENHGEYLTNLQA